MSETIWDSSYPPSLFTPPEPPPVAPTGATAGTPGAWTPPGAKTPTSLAEANALGLSLGPAWTNGAYVPLDPAGTVYWNGTAFELGVAPAAVEEEGQAAPKRARRKAEEGDS